MDFAQAVSDSMHTSQINCAHLNYCRPVLIMTFGLDSMRLEITTSIFAHMLTTS